MGSKSRLTGEPKKSLKRPRLATQHVWDLGQSAIRTERRRGRERGREREREREGEGEGEGKRERERVRQVRVRSIGRVQTIAARLSGRHIVTASAVKARVLAHVLGGRAYGFVWDVQPQQQ